jgi:ABC-type nitrate/sulfonate/bicarbonate transport system substrate-binding protein
MEAASEVDAPRARVALVNLYGEAELIPALQAGLVDGFLGVQPRLALAKEQGAGRVLSLLEDLPGALCDGPCGAGGCLVPCCALAGRADLLAKSPAAAEALVALVLASNRAIGRDPDWGAAHAAAWLGTPLSVEQRSLRTIRFFSGRDPGWDEGVRRWVARMVRTGALKGTVARGLEEGTLDRVIYDAATYERAQGRR